MGLAVRIAHVIRQIERVVIGLHRHLWEKAQSSSLDHARRCIFSILSQEAARILQEHVSSVTNARKGAVQRTGSKERVGSNARVSAAIGPVE